MGIFSNISELDHATATFISELLLLLLKLFVAARVIVASPRRTVVAQAARLGNGTLRPAQPSTRTPTFLHTCGDEADCQVSMLTSERFEPNR